MSRYAPHHAPTHSVLYADRLRTVCAAGLLHRIADDIYYELDKFKVLQPLSIEQHI